MAKIKCKCGKKIIESEKDIVIKLAGTDRETPALEKLIESYDMATEINPQVDRKAIRFIANYCYDLNIRLNRIDENLAVTSKGLAKKVDGQEEWFKRFLKESQVSFTSICEGQYKELEERISKLTKDFTDCRRWCSPKERLNIIGNPQSKNPLAMKEIAGLLHHEWDCKCNDCFSGRKKLESYLG